MYINLFDFKTSFPWGIEPWPRDVESYLNLSLTTETGKYVHSSKLPFFENFTFFSQNPDVMEKADAKFGFRIVK